MYALAPGTGLQGHQEERQAGTPPRREAEQQAEQQDVGLGRDPPSGPAPSPLAPSAVQVQGRNLRPHTDIASACPQLACVLHTRGPKPAVLRPTGRAGYPRAAAATVAAQACGVESGMGHGGRNPDRGWTLAGVSRRRIPTRLRKQETA